MRDEIFSVLKLKEEVFVSKSQSPYTRYCSLLDLSWSLPLLYSLVFWNGDFPAKNIRASENISSFGSKRMGKKLKRFYNYSYS